MMNKISSYIRSILRSDADLLYSSLHTADVFYSDFVFDLKHSKREVIIESPYLTTKRVSRLLPILSKLTKKGVRVTVTTRHPREHDGVLQAQAYTAISELHAIGVDLRIVTGHFHRKLAILDGQILWEGSLNILSQNYSVEVMRRTSSGRLSRQMRRFIGY